MVEPIVPILLVLLSLIVFVTRIVLEVVGVAL